MSTLRHRPRSVALLRLAYRIAFRVLQAWTLAAKPSARGVKCVLDDGGGRVLYVRHTYGLRDHWELPGGGVHRGETPQDGARREANEELGVDLAWAHLTGVRGHWHGKDEQLDVFAATLGEGARLRFDPVEIGDARWIARDTPPEPLGESTLAALRALRR